MAKIQHKQASSILSKTRGFTDGYDYTLNPYSGCVFGCTYCYAAFFARTDEQLASWGKWVEVKENAVDLLRKKRRKPLIDQRIYMSSVTDPYQPVEAKLELTRALLEELAAHHQVRLVVQTRSPLVTRDIDILKRFKYVRVNMTVTTDDETVRRAFEPACPPNPKRLAAIREIAAAGIPTSVTMTPLLPVRDAEAFAESLKTTGAGRFVIQNFHLGETRFAAGTGAAARALLAERGWDDAQYAAVKRVLRARLPNVYEGKAGFAPVWD